MKIEHVQIENWKPPGHDWWANVENHPDEQLIETTITLKCSWREYHELLAKDEKPALDPKLQ